MKELPLHTNVGALFCPDKRIAACLAPDPTKRNKASDFFFFEIEIEPEQRENLMSNKSNSNSFVNKARRTGGDGKRNIIEERYFDDLAFSATACGVGGGAAFIIQGSDETFENSGEGHPIHNISQRHPCKTA